MKSKYPKSLNLIFILFILSSCQFKPFEVMKEGVLVRIKTEDQTKAKKIKLQVVSDRIIHVTAIPGNKFSSRESLMAIKDTLPHPHFSYKREGNSLLIKTSSLLVNVNLSDGLISFSDTAGNLLLAEKKGGGKSFSPVTFDGEKFISPRQVFESPVDEALYGLGENQTSILNLKAKDADLFQYNTVAVVPFIVSDKNYGILWDNNSRTKFGDPRDFEELSSMKICDKNGNTGGLTATYRLKTDTTKAIISRVEKDLSYQFLHDMKKFPAGYKLGDGLVTWEGFMETDVAGDNKFLFISAGYAKLWLDGKLVLDRWRQCWNPVTTRFSLNMEKGKRYSVKVDWKPDGDESYIALKHLTPLSPEEQGQISFQSEAAEQLDYYFIAGRNMDEVVRGYRCVTGKAPIMPKWALGFWQSRERYKTQEEILNTMAEYRKRQIPIDNIVMDWFYWKEDKWGDHEFDPARFPNPDAMIKTLHDSLNAHFMISVWPKFYTDTRNFQEMESKGWLYKKNTDNKQKDWVGYVSTFYDAFNANARVNYWKDLNRKLFSKGVDAWWLDATEPDINSNMSVTERQELMNPTALGPAQLYFNAYPLVHSGGVYNGQREDDPNKRVFILTRSAFAGMQRYAAATWSGDIASTWTDMKSQIPAGLNFSISGIPYWTMDIGGFAVENRFIDAKGEVLEEWREQMARWYQFGAFCPLFRAHGQYPYREIFNIAPEGHPAYEAMLDADKLRYRLIPYIYSIAAQTWFNDYTMMRPLIMDFTPDKNVKDIADQYMFGPQLLINPVCSYKSRAREVYLPNGSGWYDLYSGDYKDGGQSIQAAAPLSHIPVYVREGSILPLGIDIQYATEKPDAPITLCIFTGMDGEFTLYEDEGTNYNYEKGAYSKIRMLYDESEHQLTVSGREGSYPGMQKAKILNIVLISKTNPFKLKTLIVPDKSIVYTGSSLTIKL